MKIGNALVFRGERSWSDRRWSNTPKWLFGIDQWALDTLGWGNLHFGWFLNPRSLTVGVSWEIISANWVGAQNKLIVRIHPLPTVTLYVTYLIPERWVKRQVGSSNMLAGHFEH